MYSWLFWLCDWFFFSFVISIAEVDEECGDECKDCHPVVIWGVHGDLPAVPAEGIQQGHAAMGMDEEEI